MLEGVWSGATKGVYQEFGFTDGKTNLLIQDRAGAGPESAVFWMIFGKRLLRAAERNLSAQNQNQSSLLVAVLFFIFPTIIVIANVIIMSGSVFPAIKSVFMRRR